MVKYRKKKKRTENSHASCQPYKWDLFALSQINYINLNGTLLTAPWNIYIRNPHFVQKCSNDQHWTIIKFHTIQQKTVGKAKLFRMIQSKSIVKSWLFHLALFRLGQTQSLKLHVYLAAGVQLSSSWNTKLQKHIYLICNSNISTQIITQNPVKIASQHDNGM